MDTQLKDALFVQLRRRDDSDEYEVAWHEDGGFSADEKAVLADAFAAIGTALDDAGWDDAHASLRLSWQDGKCVAEVENLRAFDPEEREAGA